MLVPVAVRGRTLADPGGLNGVLGERALIGRLVKRFGEAPLVIAGFASLVFGYFGLFCATVLAMRVIVAVLRDEDVQAVLEQAVTKRIVAVPWGPPLGKLLGQVFTDGAHWHGVEGIPPS